jgi:hypothetical protein
MSACSTLLKSIERRVARWVLRDARLGLGLGLERGCTMIDPLSEISARVLLLLSIGLGGSVRVFRGKGLGDAVLVGPSWHVSLRKGFTLVGR